MLIKRRLSELYFYGVFVNKRFLRKKSLQIMFASMVMRGRCLGNVN